jgi:hypothetical protein
LKILEITVQAETRMDREFLEKEIQVETLTMFQLAAKLNHLEEKAD